MYWSSYFPDTLLRYAPSFDARIVLYPGTREVRDYFSWRQTDSMCHTCLMLLPANHWPSAHINNLYNTAFWALVQQAGQTTTEAHDTLRVCSESEWPPLCSLVCFSQGTVSSQKHEILFSRFAINYNALPSRFRKGSVLVREKVTLYVSL
jgi:tRNA(His) guanylyltransferase